jgi:hypothetical protein
MKMQRSMNGRLRFPFVPSGFAAAIFLALVALLGLVSPKEANALERNFAGSAQIDYHFVPSAKSFRASPAGFDGFTTELSAKLAVDVTDHLSANIKVCFGCHGFETDMMYFDYRVKDSLNFRIGRFSPSFGAFNLRHDPANHRLSDKPLAYDMGRMLRMRQWNLGVLPSPFPDTGVEINGTKWVSASVQLDYAAYAVSGFKGPTNGLDFQFRDSRTPFYVDNNARPAGGARLAMTAKLGETVDLTVGSSGMFGTWDPENKLTYAILGGDVTLRLEKTTFRAEYLVRRQQFSTDDPSQLKFTLPATGGDYFLKHGAYAEVERSLTQDLDLIGRFDLLHRTGNVAKDSELSETSSMLRYTLGMAYLLERGLRLKLSTELYQYSDRGVDDRKVDVSTHLGVAGTF